MFRPYFRMCLAGFVLDFTIIAGLTATPFFVFNQLGGGAAMSGVFGAAQAASYAITCLASAGLVSRARNGLNWAAAGIALYTVAYCVMPVFRNPWLCGGLGTVASAALGFTWPALHAWVGAEPDPPTRARHMAWFNISWSFGFAVSPLLAGPLYDYDYRLPFIALFFLGGVTLLLVRSLPHERAYFGVATEAMLEARGAHDRASEVYLYSAWCATLVANALVGVIRSVYPKRVDELVASGDLRLFFESAPAQFLTSGAATKYSWIAFAHGLAIAVAFLTMGRTSRWHHKFRLMFWLQVLAGGAFWVLGHTRSLAVMMLCFVVVGANLGVAFFASVYYSVANPEHKHRRAAINEGAVGVGVFIGSMAFGYLAGHYGLALPFHYTPLFIAVAVVLEMALIRYGRGKALRKTPVHMPPLTPDAG